MSFNAITVGLGFSDFRNPDDLQCCYHYIEISSRMQSPSGTSPNKKKGIYQIDAFCFVNRAIILKPHPLIPSDQDH
jgi:hypothetical protein